MSLSLQQKIATIQEAKDNIKTAIINKGVMPEGNITTYADAISQIDTVNNQAKTVVSNGVVFPDEGYTGLSQVTVSVNQNVQDKNITENGTYTASSGYIGLGTVTVDVNPTRVTKTITDNGTFFAEDDNAYGYSQVTINVPKGITREVKNGVYQKPSESFTFSLPSNANDLDSYVLYYAFYTNNALEAVDLSSLTSITGNYALSNFCSGGKGLKTVDLSNVVTITGQYILNDAFRDCSNLESVDLSSLTSIGDYVVFNNAFWGCKKLREIDLSSLVSVGSQGLYNAFTNCLILQNVNLNSLQQISSSHALSRAFQNTALTSLSFPSLTSSSFGSYTNQFYYMLSGVTGCTVHFPSNLQSVIGNWSDVLTGFGGVNTTVLFDLEATA